MTEPWPTAGAFHLAVVHLVTTALRAAGNYSSKVATTKDSNGEYQPIAENHWFPHARLKASRDDTSDVCGSPGSNDKADRALRAPAIRALSLRGAK
jgi:hypothetical protein